MTATEILAEFDGDPERMAEEIATLRERLTETWAMASQYQKTAITLSHCEIGVRGLVLVDTGGRAAE